MIGDTSHRWAEVDHKDREYQIEYSVAVSKEETEAWGVKKWHLNVEIYDLKVLRKNAYGELKNITRYVNEENFEAFYELAYTDHINSGEECYT